MMKRDWQDDGAPTFVNLSKRVQVSRKPRICEWCSRPIQTGERYERDVYLEDGEFRMVVGHPFGGLCVLDKEAPDAT